MTCELYDSPCEYCTEHFCPDQLDEIEAEHFYLKLKIRDIKAQIAELSSALIVAEDTLLLFERDNKDALTRRSW